MNVLYRKRCVFGRHKFLFEKKNIVAVLAEYKTNVDIMNKIMNWLKSRHFEMYRTSRIHCSHSDNSMSYLRLICAFSVGKKEEIINWKMVDKKNATHSFVNVYKLGKKEKENSNHRRRIITIVVFTCSIITRVCI